MRSKTSIRLPGSPSFRCQTRGPRGPRPSSRVFSQPGRRRYLHGRFPNGVYEYRLPAAQGRDVAGTVEAVGPEVTAFRPGDEVLGMAKCDYIGDGTFADYVVVPEDRYIVPRPDELPLADAGVVGLAGVTALQCLDALGCRTGDTVLINGATGGWGPCHSDGSGRGHRGHRDGTPWNGRGARPAARRDRRRRLVRWRGARSGTAPASGRRARRHRSRLPRQLVVLVDGWHRNADRQSRGDPGRRTR